MLSVIRDSVLNIWPVVISWRAVRMSCGWGGWGVGGVICAHNAAGGAKSNRDH